MPANPAQSRHRLRRRPGAGGRRGRPRQRAGARSRSGGTAAGAGARGGRGAGRGGLSVQGLPLIKPPYDRITAYDMNTGEIVWQKTHSSTPDDIKNHPALQGLNLPRLGQPGRTFIGTLTTKTLLIAGEGGVHRNDAGERVALLRAYDKRTGADVGAVEMPAQADRIADDLHDQRQAVHRRSPSAVSTAPSCSPTHCDEPRVGDSPLG